MKNFFFILTCNHEFWESWYRNEYASVLLYPREASGSLHDAGKPKSNFSLLCSMLKCCVISNDLGNALIAVVSVLSRYKTWVATALLPDLCKRFFRMTQTDLTQGRGQVFTYVPVSTSGVRQSGSNHYHANEMQSGTKCYQSFKKLLE